MLEFDLFKEEKLPKNIREVSNYIKKLEKKVEALSEEIKNLKKDSKFSVQKTGLVRYNPFQDLGGDQSFSIALLDGNNNGVVITSLYAREGNRVFAKSIEKGESKYSLSGEEIEAIKKAIKES